MTLQMGLGYPTAREGLNYPIPFCSPSHLVEIAIKAETLGFHSLGGNDHIVPATYVSEHWDVPPRYYELFTTFAHIAGLTHTIRLNTSVAVLPLRNVVWLAKQAATLDCLSTGRLTLGVGVGAYPEEFSTLFPNVPLTRGIITDHSIEALVDLLSKPSSYNSEYVKFGPLDLYPRPKQNPLPIYIGGNHHSALERSAKWGQGWLPAGLSPSNLEEKINHLSILASDHGRSLSDIDIAPQLTLCIAKTTRAAHKKFRESHQYTHLKSLLNSTFKNIPEEELLNGNLIGTSEEIVKRLQEYMDIGVTHFPATVLAVNDISTFFSDMELISRDILDLF
ncbi:MAG: TIGR03619 family F420-dependent LLM class oxidoreductase [Halobacteriales archaeon]